MNTDYTIFSAPLQGYTDHVWRNAHAATFGAVDVYCAPFMRIDHGAIRKRDINDISAGNNSVPCLLPQLLAGKPDEATTLARTIMVQGYTHIDINLGCPHPPVANKHKGAGLLKYPDELTEMLKALSEIDGVDFSVKMRLGWDGNTQWQDALKALETINPKHVTIHPRIGTQQYKGELDTDQLAAFMAACPYPVVYNGALMCPEDITKVTEEFGNLKGIMIGRGLIARPYMLTPDKLYMLEQFHEMLVEGYTERLDGGESQLVNKMKSLWEEFLPHADRKARKAIKKSHNMSQYMSAASEAIDSVVNGDEDSL